MIWPRRRLNIGPRLALIAMGLCVSVPGGASSDGSYTGLLELLTTQSRSDCLAELQRYESSAVDLEKPGPSLQKLSAGELGVLRKLARQGSPEALLPVITLHLDSYLYYLRNDARFLMRHSRRMTLATIDLYLDSSDGEDAPGVASWLLTKLAGDVLQTRSRIAAQRVLERALELSPGNGRARLGLAAIREKEGSYDEVVLLLAPAEPQPSDRPESDLRLAINLARLEQRSDAADLFQQLLGAPETPPWIRSLANQELARLLFEAEQWDRARQLLEEAVEVLPEDESLLLQLAYSLERLGSPRAAQAVAESTEPEDRDESQSGADGDELRPRDRYNRYPRLASSRQEQQRFDDWLAEMSGALEEALVQFRGGR